MTSKNTFERYGILPNSRQSGDLELSLRCLVRFYRTVLAELKPKSAVPWNTRMNAWRLGFKSKSWDLYKLDENDPGLYLPDLSSLLKSYKINGFSNPIIGNKLVLSRLLATHQVPHPNVISTIQQGKLTADDVPFDPDMTSTLMRTLDRYPRQVFRPTWSGGGQGVFFLNRVDESLRLNGKEISTGEACELLSRLDRYMATEFQDQAPYAKSIYPGSTNTIRILTLWDVERWEPFIAAVSHRFGSSRSAPIDNFHQGRGGVCAAVNLDTSNLGPAWRLTDDVQLVSEEIHYESGMPIEGVVVPGFKNCIDGVLKAASHFPYCPMIGWDVLLTKQGFCIVEANSTPGLTVLQVHTPLLKDPRSRKFFQHWGLIPDK